MSRQIYNLPARFFHWVTFILLIPTVVLGFVGSDMVFSPLKIEIFALHKSFGVSVWFVTVLRILWRFGSTTPHPVRMGPVLLWMSKITHLSLYMLLIAVPVLGWLTSSAWQVPVSWFGFFELPIWIEPSRSMAELLGEIHEILAISLLSIIGLHVFAAFFHQLILRDHLIRRMWK
ncbi:MAG: cytochrome b [Pseudomonadota bacterium]